MATAKGLLVRAVARGRAARDRGRAAVSNLRPPTRTALRIPHDRRVPPPGRFARFGDGSWVVPPARVQGAEGIEIGAGVTVLECSGLHVDAQGGARLVVGDRTRLAKGVEIVCTTRVTIGAAVSSSDYVTISDSWTLLGAPEGAPPPPPAAPVVIEDGAYLGWGSTVGPGVTVGAGAFIGEGAVVLADVAPHSVVYGNPARPVRHYDVATGHWSGARFG